MSTPELLISTSNMSTQTTATQTQAPCLPRISTLCHFCGEPFIDCCSTCADSLPKSFYIGPPQLSEGGTTIDSTGVQPQAASTYSLLDPLEDGSEFARSQDPRKRRRAYALDETDPQCYVHISSPAATPIGKAQTLFVKTLLSGPSSFRELVSKPLKKLKESSLARSEE